MSANLKSVASAQAGLDFERALFEGRGQKVEIWTSLGAGLVCPRAYRKKAGFDLAAERTAARGWPVVFRPTGGGTVPQSPGIDNLVLACDVPDGTMIEDVYRLLTQVIRQGMGDIGAALVTGDTPGSFCDGAWNLSANGRKIVGTAQRWRPNRTGQPRVLAHAIILTRGSIHKAAEAVARFHEDLGLGVIDTDAHTSLEAEFGLDDLPSAEIMQAAEHALTALSEQAK